MPGNSQGSDSDGNIRWSLHHYISGESGLRDTGEDTYKKEKTSTNDSQTEDTQENKKLGSHSIYTEFREERIPFTT